MTRRKAPSAKVRRRGAPQLPLNAERDFARGLVMLADRLTKKLGAIFLPLAKEIGREHEEDRTDADDEDAAKSKAKGAGSRGRSAASSTFTSAAVKKETDRAARKVEAHSKDQFRKFGIDVDKEPVLKHLVSGWTKDVSGRVSKMGQEQVSKLEAILSSGHSRFAKTLAKEIENQLGVTRSRAEFIARDSILTLNSKITRERFRAAGIEDYAWTTMGDEKVREKHAELDGQVFAVDGDGDSEEGHPGEPDNCRCIQWPLPPKDAPKGDDEDDGGDDADDEEDDEDD